MQTYARLGAAAVLLFAIAVHGQTPPGSHPVASKELGVHYERTEVTPDVLLPQTLVDSGTPTAYLNSTIIGQHMVMLVDLAIPQSSINQSYADGPEFYPGLVPCRTTRLHWYQGNLTQTSNGTFTSTTSAIAAYGGPMPGLNDIAHTYTFYLFAQPANFTLPAWDAGRVYDPISVYARMNFSVQAIADVAGDPVAANYMRVVNPKNNATGTAANGTCPSTSSNSSGTAGATATSSSVQAATYTGLATRLEGGMVWSTMAAAGLLAFATT